MYIYFEAKFGCGIREAYDCRSAKKSLIKQYGTENTHKLIVRKASGEDIGWVGSMGGWIPRGCLIRWEKSSISKAT